jgi:hypothetical protein
MTRTMRDLLSYQDDVAGEQDVDQKNKRYLDKEKVRLLNDYVFRSMANIIFFFRATSIYPQLKEIFENDIKDLLGVRRENPQPDNYGFIFSALVRSVLLTERDELYLKEEMPGEDLSLRLNQILLENVWARIKLSLTKVFERNPAALRAVEDDFNRAWAWVRILAKGTESAREDNRTPHRTLVFGRVPMREDEYV